MNSFEYALGLLAIVVGLGLAELSVSFHRLARNARSVTWDSRVAITVLLVLVETVRIWFAQWSIRDEALAVTFPFYIALFLQNMLLFLLAAACLPDDPPSDCDLGTFYERNRRYFWSLYLAYQTCYVGLWFYFGGQMNTVGAATPFDWFRVFMPLGVFALLVWRRERWLHLALPLGMIAFYLAIYWTQTLALTPPGSAAGR